MARAANQMADPATVVIDNGTGYTKMGYAGNMEPSYLIPSVIAKSVPKQGGIGAKNKFSNPELDFFIGEEAQSKQKSHDVSFLLKSGQIQDWDGIEKFWHKSIHSYLRCDPEEHRFILTEPPMNTPENREQMAEIMFETFNVKGLFIGVQATLALYAQIANKSDEEESKTARNDLNDISDMTGTVIDAGDGVTHVFPVCDGYVISSCVKHIPLAGRDITAYTLQSLRDRGETFVAGDGNEIAAKIKEKYGYVAKDVLKEFNSYDKKTTDEATGQLVQSNKFKKFVHKTLNGNMVDIDVGYERFLGPEMFFHPEFVHQDFSKPLGEVVDDAIQSCPIEYRIKLYENVVLSGGSTLFKGFDSRLKSQVQRILDQRMAAFNQISGREETMSCNVFQNIVQRYAVWFGGSVLGSHQNFPQLCKSREMYEEYGPSICRHNAIFGQDM